MILILIYEHPELSNREVETGKYLAAQLEALGIEVRTGVAHTGVVGVLRGGKPGPVVALRADMDAAVKFIFQPAEEGTPAGEEGRTRLMVQEGVLSQDPPAGDVRVPSTRE